MIRHEVSRLVVLGFDRENAAFELRSLLEDLEDDGLIELSDAVVVTRNEKGKVRLHQSTSLAAFSAAAGSVAGYVVGMLFLNPLFGSIAGAGTGAVIGALTDRGILDTFMKELGATLTPGSSALFVAIRKSDPDEILKRLTAFCGKAKLLQTSIPEPLEAVLRQFFEGQPLAPSQSESAAGSSIPPNNPNS